MHFVVVRVVVVRVVVVLVVVVVVVVVDVVLVVGIVVTVVSVVRFVRGCCGLVVDPGEAEVVALAVVVGTEAGIEDVDA